MAEPLAALRNVVQILQIDPKAYRLFGLYWWPIKKLLIAGGYGPDQLYMLGTYQDAKQADEVVAMPLAETLEAAFVEYAFNATYPHADGQVEAPDGELMTIYDEDAGL